MTLGGSGVATRQRPAGASDREFRHRFWISAVIYSAAFACYGLDNVNMSVALVRGVLGLLGEQDLSVADQHLRWPLAFATLLVALGAMLRTWAAAYLRRDVVHDTDLRTERLVADGPYRYLRNPLYLGSELLAIGVGLLTSRLGFLVLVMGTLVHFGRLIRREEAELEVSQGEEYRRYRASVPRLIPVLPPKVAPGGRPPEWAQAFIGEQFMWLSATAMAMFTVTLRPVLFCVPVAAGLLVYGLRQFAMKSGGPPRRHDHDGLRGS